MPQGVSLSLPAFLSSKDKFTKEEAIFSRKVARSRIHVEKISTNLRPFSSLIIQVCCALVNLQTPIISGVINAENDDMSGEMPVTLSFI